MAWFVQLLQDLDQEEDKSLREELELGQVTVGDAGGDNIESGDFAVQEDEQHRPSDVTAYDRTYALRDSVWDLALLIGMPRVGILGSIFSGTICLCNAAIQMLLCCIINDTFTQRSVDDEIITEMRRWRTSAGHDLKFVDRHAAVPLVKRICSFDGSVPISSSVQNVLDLIKEYYPYEADYLDQQPFTGHILPYFKGVGGLMCTCALCIWVLNVVCDIRNTFDMAWGLYEVPHGDSTRIVDSDHNDVHHSIHHQSKHRVLVASSYGRKAFCCLVLGLKLYVACSLCFFGTLFLVFTISIQDLLLNAAALQLVLQLDELFYSAWVPFQASLLKSSLRPLPLPPVRSWKGLDLWPPMVMSTLITFLLVIIPIFLLPQAELLADAREEICGGNTDFISTIDKSGIVRAVRTTGNDNDHFLQSYEFKAIRQLIDDPGVVEKKLGDGGSLSSPGDEVTGAAFSSDEAAALSLVDATDLWNPGCSDLITTSSSGVDVVYRSILQDVTGNRSLDSCLPAQQYCSWDTLVGRRTRQFCPMTCGCHNPGSGLAIVSRLSPA